jgi:AAA+ ATPase superfamily predicted ATPase
MAENPFDYGKELLPEMTFNRLTEIREVVETILHAGRLFLIGPRRHGKTTILALAALEAEQQKAVVLRYNIEAFDDLDQLTAAIIADATPKLTPKITQVAERGRKFFPRLRPTLKYDGQTWEATVDLAESPEAATPRLIEALNGLNRLAGQSKRPVGLLLDEFQKVIEMGGAKTEAQIRAAAQQHNAVGYVFTGSKTRLLADMTTSPDRPFYRMGKSRYVSKLPRPEFETFLAKRFKTTGITLTEEAARLILDLAEEVPHNVQLLAKSCWERSKARQRRVVNPEVVEETYLNELTEMDFYYTALWNQFTAVQKRALHTIKQRGGQGMYTNLSLDFARLKPAAMRSALKILEERGIIRSEGAKGETLWVFDDPFFSGWITRVRGKF